MPDIFDLLAKITWDTNPKELQGVTTEYANQDKLLKELNLQQQKLAEQIAKTTDPVKVKRLNDELLKVKKTEDAILTSKKNQVTQTDILKTMQNELLQKIKQTSDPAIMQGLIRQLRTVEGQLNGLSGKAVTTAAKLNTMGTGINTLLSSFTGGLVGGGLITGLTIGLQALSGVIGNSAREFEDAKKTMLDLERALKVIGKGELLRGLTDEAGELAVKFHNLFDNDDIIKAQTALVNYGKLGRESMSQLLPVILELATAERIDLAQATEKVVNILEGRGGQTLRDYGLSVKGVKTEHDRLNLVLGEFATKLKGSADTYATTAEGIRQTNAVLIADIEERFGESFSSIKTSFQRLLLPVLESLADALKTYDQRQEDIQRGTGNFVSNLLSPIEANIPDSVLMQRIERRTKEVEKLSQAVQANNDLINQHLSVAKSMDARDRNKVLQEELNNRAGELAALEKIRDRRRKAKDGNDPLNPNAKLAEETEKSEKKAAKTAEQIREERYQKELKALEEKNLKELFLIEGQYEAKTIDEAKYQDKTLLQDMLFYQQRIELMQRYGKNTLQVQIDLLKKYEAFNKRTRSKQPGVTGEFLPGSGGDTSFPNASATDTAGFIAERNAELDQANKNFDSIREHVNTEFEKVKEKKEEEDRLTREALQSLEDSAISAADTFIQQELRKLDAVIDAQEKRVSAARDSSTASLKIEEDRLQELLSKRRKFEQAQRVIDAGVIAANQAVAISGAIATIAKGGNPILIAANVAAIIAGIAASVFAIRGAIADDGFYEGGYTGDGDARHESTALGKRGYKYHKKEFVMNAGLTEKHRDMFEGIHTGKLSVQKMDDGRYYLGPTIDVNTAVDHFNAKDAGRNDNEMIRAELARIGSLLERREVNVQNNFDADGFGQSVAVGMGQLNLKNLRSNQ